ncbi:hypothetical protein P691DRAFT_769491 [Macrolepiota fuliginosa MF-IS2]|uniref:Uncharacterized protein n=1 Tax=Macrolepiota fuliginosa MF-IS2 TaxID=1400762 RepID=A0A9P6BUC0_9AGAR|nr:hypothetical protein P691DRAFT_769491 [Macrolepiota fuliginosa MF-IS2]
MDASNSRAWIGVDVISALVRGEIPLRPEPNHSDWDEIGDEMWALMESCWSFTPEDRLSLQDIYNRFSKFHIPDDRPEVQDDPGRGLTRGGPIKLDFDRVEKVLLNSTPTDIDLN